MKKYATLLLGFLLLAACSTEKSTEEAEQIRLLKEQNELLKNQLATKKNEPAERPKAKPPVPAKKSITVDQIKQDLLNQSVSYWHQGALAKVKKQWVFASLAEYKSVEVENEQVRDNYQEKTLAMTLQDQATGERFYARMLVSYNKHGEQWVLSRWDALQFSEIK
ncbi:hypothetical protein [Salmonirosea aquatica]|uniref:Uncharacterized protein n=1 Tax=Salmonirosea aquatica TaxID=2654236 RepID=A0A7C9F932_9BACT|nr:hypothetical protein [Cytophagaceae bacterium SJW1-29]MPR37146.1 hypothetical protein [Cytophagaceae bacterium SJW1-29]